METTTLSKTELIETVKGFRGEIMIYRDYINETALDDLSSIPYSYLNPASNNELEFVPLSQLLFVSAFCLGSDYSGSSVEAANYKCLGEESGNPQETGIFPVYGDFGTYAIAIRLDSFTDKLLETFKRLEDCPLINEEVMYEIEEEGRQEAWESWIKYDFTSLLRDRFPELEDTIDLMEDSKLESIFWTASREAEEEGKTYWENETGNSMWIRLEEVIPLIKESDITL